MPPGMQRPSAGYNFNYIQEIKSHSSYLFNERAAILLYLLDMKSIRLNTYHEIDTMLEVKSILLQIYKNVRTLIRNNPTMRATLNLETKDEGIYITDVAMGMVDRMVEYCMINGYTYKRLYIIITELNNLEMLIKDILQYYHYFIRPDFKQKPDVEIATEIYKEISDKATVEELKQIVGKRHQVDFENLGSERIELTKEVEFDDVVDGEVEEEEIEGEPEVETPDDEG